MKKYIVNMVSKHEERIDIVGFFDTSDEAEKAMSKDIYEVANGFDGVDISDVYVEDDGDWTGKVEYADECFIWAIHGINV